MLIPPPELEIVKSSFYHKKKKNEFSIFVTVWFFKFFFILFIYVVRYLSIGHEKLWSLNDVQFIVQVITNYPSQPT